MAKSTTKYMKFRGESSWGRLYEPDEYGGKKFWKINLHPTDETIKKIQDAGIQNKKKDKAAEGVDSPVHFTFKRDFMKTFGKDVTYFTPPAILDKDGKPLVQYKVNGEVARQFKEGDTVERIGEPVLIGNGSEIEVELEVYQTQSFGKGSRLVSVKILDLIEYVPPEDVEPDEEAEVEVVEEKERLVSAAVSKPKKTTGKVPW